MNRAWTLNVSVRSVEREPFWYAPQTPWQIQGQGFRVKFHTNRAIDLLAQDQLLVIVGEEGTANWAAFIGTVVECEPDSLLLYTSPQYEAQLMDIRRLEREFSPLASILGAQHVIETLGYFPPFHYDEITDVQLETVQNIQSLSLVLTHNADQEWEQQVHFHFEHIQQEMFSPVEASNVCLQLSFTYAADQIRVNLDAVSGFSATFLCSTIHIQFH